jgi:hypothetical protein
MDVIDMRVKISFIPDQVFPVPVLPDRTSMRVTADAGFYEPPAGE